MIRQVILRRGLVTASSSTKSYRGFASANGLVNLTVNDKTGIATLELNRPPINSLNTALLTDISSALDELTKNRSKGMILTSVSWAETHFQMIIHNNWSHIPQSSKTVFSGGIDLMELYKPVPEKAKLFWSSMQEVWLKLYGSSFPTAAAINVRNMESFLCVETI